MFYGISELEWHNITMSLTSHVTIKRESVVLFYTMLVILPFTFIFFHTFVRTQTKVGFYKSIEKTLDKLAIMDKLIFRPKGLMVRLETNHDKRTMDTGDLYHERHVDDMTVMQKRHPPNPDQMQYVREEIRKNPREYRKAPTPDHSHIKYARDEMLKRPRLVVAPTSMLEGIDENNIWSIWDHEAKRRRGEKDEGGMEATKAIARKNRESIINASKLLPDTEVVDETVLDIDFPNPYERVGLDEHGVPINAYGDRVFDQQEAMRQRAMANAMLPLELQH
jgi:hypothetical protein